MELLFMFILFVIFGIGAALYKGIIEPLFEYFSHKEESYSTGKEYGEEIVIGEEETPDKTDEPLKVEIKNPQFDTSRITEYKGEEIKAFEFRPQAWEQFIGQLEGKNRARTIIKKAKRGIKCHFLVDGIKGHGKCHRKGTKILMADGRYKNVEEITIGNLVMGTDNKPKKVKKIGNGYGQMYSIISKRKTFVVNGEHILSLRKIGTTKILNVSVIDFLKLPINIQQMYELYRIPINFSYKSTPLDPYYIGLWLGDGSNQTQRITNIEPEIRNYLKNYSKKLKLQFIHKKPKNRSDYLSITSGRGGKQNKYNLQAELRKLNLLNNKHIPDIYKYNDRKTRLELLAGLIDTDGWLNGGLCYEITSKYKILTNDIKYVAQSLGFFSYISPQYIKLAHWTKRRKYFRVKIIGNCSIIPTKIFRKKASKNEMTKNPLLYSQTQSSRIKIQKLNKKEKYYGFELEGNHLYMIEDFIVNHNTTFVELLAKSLNAKLIERVGKQVDEDSLVNIINEINTSTEKYVIFFLDEIETTDWRVIKILNPIIEQFKINNVKIKPFIFAGATINKHILIKNNPDTLDRIPTHIKFARYTAEDIGKIVKQYREQLYPNEKVSDEVMKIISKNAKFNPRTAILTLLEDYIVEQDIKKVLKNAKIIRDGLNEIDIEILKVLSQSTRAMGANALAMRVKLSQKEYVTEFEPFLVEYGYINRVPSRVITDKGKQLLEDLK